MQCIILFGIQHSGKTSAGKLLAEYLQVPFFDIDTLIEQECGKSCRELYVQEGAQAFQRAELKACRLFRAQIEKLSGQQAGQKHTEKNETGAVCATGGGICDNPKALTVLEQIGRCIYIDIPEAEAFARIRMRAQKQGSFPAYIENKKPKNDDDREKIFRYVYERRTKKYRQRFSLCLNAAGLNPEQVCAALAALSRSVAEAN